MFKILKELFGFPSYYSGKLQPRRPWPEEMMKSSGVAKPNNPAPPCPPIAQSQFERKMPFESSRNPVESSTRNMKLQEIKQQIETHQRAIGELKFAAKKQFMAECQALANSGYNLSIDEYTTNNGIEEVIVFKVIPENGSVKVALARLYDVATSLGVKTGYCEFKIK